MNEIKNENEIIESLEIYDKVIRMIDSSENKEQLLVCRNYFNIYKERHEVSEKKKLNFERKFEDQRILILKKNLRKYNV